MTLTLPGDVELERVLELYEGFAEAGVPVRGGDTSSAGRIVVSVTALGRSDRVPGRAGARPGDLLVVTGPLGAAGAAFRQGRYVRPPLRMEEGLRLGAVADAMLDVSDGIARRRRSPRPPLRLSPRDRPRRRAAGGRARRPRLRRGLRAARRDARSARLPGRSARVEEGEGVVLLHDGEPYDLPGYQHFT